MSKIAPYKRFKKWIAYRLVVSLIWFVRRAPRSVSRWLFQRLGGVAFELFRKERKKTLKHLSMAYGDSKTDLETRQLGKQVFRQLALNIVDGMRLPIIVKEGLYRHLRFVGKEHFDKAFERGKGVIGLTGHIGCWELLAAVLAYHYPVKVIGASLYDPRLDAILVDQRMQAGYESLPRDARGTRQIIRWLRQGCCLGVLIDQDTRVGGEFVEFFGRPAFTPVGPVYIAQRTGAAIVPVVIYMNEDGTHTAEARPEITLQQTGDEAADRRANLQACSLAVEQLIREHPTQWVWMHRRWRKKPPAETT